MISLKPVFSELDIAMLYELLKERTPEQSISHRVMPSFDEHMAFVLSRPYFRWYMIVERRPVGAIYLSHQREIGLSIFRDYQRLGYGRAAVAELMRLHPGFFLANINPNNDASIAFWKSLGFTLRQVTYAK